MVSNSNRFVIRNGSRKPVTIDVEPEGVVVPLGENEEVTVKEVFATIPVTIKITTDEAGDLVLSIWPGDGDVVVEKNGVDVLDLV